MSQQLVDRLHLATFTATFQTVLSYCYWPEKDVGFNVPTLPAVGLLELTFSRWCGLRRRIQPVPVQLAKNPTCTARYQV